MIAVWGMHTQNNPNYWQIIIEPILLNLTKVWYEGSTKIENTEEVLLFSDTGYYTDDFEIFENIEEFEEKENVEVIRLKKDKFEIIDKKEELSAFRKLNYIKIAKFHNYITNYKIYLIKNKNISKYEILIIEDGTLKNVYKFENINIAKSNFNNIIFKEGKNEM